MIRVGILKNEDPYSHVRWEQAAKNAGVEYFIVDITRNDWLDKITAEKYDILLFKPPGLTSQFKELYDERAYILSEVLKLPVYPTLNEIKIYENKRFLSYYLRANKIPHPETNVFYHKDEAVSFLKSNELPVVAKMNIGAAGNGIKIIRSVEAGEEYINKAFSPEGIVARTGPKVGKVSVTKRLMRLLKEPTYYFNRIKSYRQVRGDAQRNFVIFQKFVEHDFEWRAVVIGDSYFAHKKMKKGEMASNSLMKDYSTPPESLIRFVKDLREKHNLQSQAVDVFEAGNDKYLVNEMQAFFGQSDSFQMRVDGEIGRYYFDTEDNMKFEAGDFNTTESYDLRMQHAIKIVSELKKTKKS